MVSPFWEKNDMKQNRSNTTNMTAGSPMKLMLTFALPLMAGNVCQQLYTITDTAIVGRGVGISALAALGCTDWLGFLLFATAQGFTQGFSIKMSQEYGAGSEEGLKRAVGTSAILSAFLAVVCTVLGLVLLPFFLRVLNVPDELYDMAFLYMAILFGGVGTALFNNFCASTLRAVGNSRTPLTAMPHLSTSFWTPSRSLFSSGALPELRALRSSPSWRRDSSVCGKSPGRRSCASAGSILFTISRPKSS